LRRRLTALYRRVQTIARGPLRILAMLAAKHQSVTKRRGPAFQRFVRAYTRLARMRIGEATARTGGDVPPTGSRQARTSKNVAEGRENTSSPPRFTTLQNAVVTAGVVFMLAVCIAGGWAFVDRFRNPPPPLPVPAAVKKLSPSVVERAALS